MALLQIHEPGQTPAPHAQEPAIGIDLGTTNSVVAVAENGMARVLTSESSPLVPSVIWYAPDGKAVVGESAREKLMAGDTGAIGSVKRLMAAGRGDFASLHLGLPYRLAEQDNGHGMVSVEIGGRARNPVEMSADILRALKRHAETALGAAIRQAVITVPAYFDEAARSATKEAARLAGITVLRLVNEPTAAALAYGLDSGAEGIYAVYDLGGGTFDISLLRLQQGVFQVLATGGNARLGGDDFDHAIAAFFCRQAGIESLREDMIWRWLGLARQAKEWLTDHPDSVWKGSQDGFTLALNRAECHNLLETLVENTLSACQQTLDDAGLVLADIHGVVLVGGSTRLPLVREKVAAFFGQAPLTGVDPDRVVAMGAALQAEGLIRGASTLLLDVTPLSLGIETMGGIVEKIIHRNTPIPASVTQSFTTYQDGQTGMDIHVVQGEREHVDQCRSLAQFKLGGIPPMVAGAARVRVTFGIDADGLLTVHAREESTGHEQSVAVKPTYGLSEGEIERMLRDSMQHARQDMEDRLLMETKVEARRNILALEAALRKDGNLLSAGERAGLLQQLAVLRDAADGGDRDAIRAEAECLEKQVQIFAARRMEAGVVSTLKGREVDALAKKLSS